MITVELYKDGAPDVVNEFIDACVKHDAFMMGTSKGKHGKEGFELVITTAPIPDLNEKLNVFGRVIRGEDVVQEIEEVDTDEHYRPKSSIGIIDVKLELKIKSKPVERLSTEYKPNVLDNLFLNSFRNKMVQECWQQEAGWDSGKPGYDGLIEVANRLMIGRSNSETTEAAVRILRSLFPPLLLELYKLLIAPIAGGKVAAVMVGKFVLVRVFVERCKYLEESKCVGICINTCKLPTQTFMKAGMGVPLLMEPNFSDYSCQGSLNLEFCHPYRKMISLSKNLVWRYAQIPLEENKSLITWKHLNVPRHRLDPTAPVSNRP
uniref:PPIase cyclophilin-type domain-containing protein n=1 Tax=Daucus carota subsp. sativus TaxID=79200 RepID=A0A166HGM5_DAUCS